MVQLLLVWQKPDGAFARETLTPAHIDPLKAKPTPSQAEQERPERPGAKEGLSTKRW